MATNRQATKPRFRISFPGDFVELTGKRLSARNDEVFTGKSQEKRGYGGHSQE
jgi:hypothetical protein